MNCQIHLQEFTNFCSSQTCYLPLCPECIDDHLQMHKQEKSKSSILAMSYVRKGCFNKIQNTLNLLKEMVNSPLLNVSKNPERFKNQQKDYIELCKRKINKIIDEEFQRKFLAINEDNKQYQNQDQIIRHSEEIIDELEDFKDNILKQDDIDMIVRVCQLDAKGIIDKTKKDIYAQKNESQFVKCDMEMIEKYIKEAIKIGQADLDMFKDIQIQQQDDITINQTKNIFSQGNIQKRLLETEEKYQNMFEKTPPKSLNYNKSQQIIDVSHFSSAQKKNFQPLNINIPNFYDKKTKRKLLHFFSDNLLHTYNLERYFQLNINSNILISNTTKIIKIKTVVPQFHRSISTPQGVIYLLGGTTPMGKNPYIFTYEDITQSLIQVGQMILPRSSFGICYYQGYIYSASGIAQSLTSSFERYNVITQKSEQLAPSFQQSNAPSLACLDSYIYKFGAATVEKYNILKNEWQTIELSWNKQGFQQFPSFTAAYPINTEQIVIFGGYDSEGIPSSKTFIWEEETFQLPFTTGFWSSQVIVFQNQLFVVANGVEENDDQIDQKRLIFKLSQNGWKEIGHI